MADASRFPDLTFPFAIVGAAAGWLSAGLVMHPIVRAADPLPRVVAALAATAFGAATGALLRHWCVGRRYDYQFEAPDPETRAATDTWARRAPTLLFAGTATGALVALTCDSFFPVELAALGGFLCTLPFLPVCGAVLAAARRAQRARHGSLVAASDRRAVWGILAITLVAVTLEALPDWAAPSPGGYLGPEPGFGLLVAATVGILAILVADVVSFRRAARRLAPGLIPRAPGEIGREDGLVPRLDLGLGDELHAHLVRDGSAYRGGERTLALVDGDPAQALRALRRAIGRGVAGLALAAAVFAAHRVASSAEAALLYEERRCELGLASSCGLSAAHALRAFDFAGSGAQRAILLYEKGCNGNDPVSCAGLAELYRGAHGVEHDGALVAFFEYRTDKAVTGEDNPPLAQRASPP